MSKINIDKDINHLENFLNYLSAVLCRSDRTVKEYRYDIMQFLNFICEKTISDIVVNQSFNLLEHVTPTIIHSYISELSKRNISNCTKARKLTSLRSFFKYLVNSGLLNSNVMNNINSPRIERKLPISLSLANSIDLLKSFDNESDEFFKIRNQCITTLFLNCGLRLSELSALKVRQVQSSTIVVNGKGNRERTIYLNQSAAVAISKWLTHRYNFNCEYLFITKKNTRLKNGAIQSMIKQSMGQIGLDTNKYSVHKLRHTAATLMYQYGKTDILVLQKFLGHASVSTTQIYTHVSDAQLQAASISNPLSAL